MLPYYLLVFLPVIPLFVVIKGHSPDKRQQNAMLLFFLLLFFMLALRSINVGRDLYNYRNIFESYSQQTWHEIFSDNTEIGYSVLNKIISLFTADFQWLLVICAFLSIVPIAYVYINEVEIPMLTISLYITMSTFVMLFSGLRQSIAISLGALAYLCTKNKKPFLFLLVSFFALLFHRSAFMLLFMYPAYHIRITKRKMLLVFPLIVLLLIFNKQIFVFLSSFISDWYSSSIENTGAYAMLILLTLLAVFSFIIPNDARLDDNIFGLRNFLIMSLVIQMFAPLHYLAMRMNYYYLIFIPLLIPKIINRSSLQWKQVAVFAKYIMTVFFIAYFFISAQKTDALDTFPYYFFWENGI